jgi:hypothetical protein
MGYGGCQPLSSKHFFTCGIQPLEVSWNASAVDSVTSRQGPAFSRKLRKFKRFAAYDAWPATPTKPFGLAWRAIWILLTTLSGR